MPLSKLANKQKCWLWTRSNVVTARSREILCMKRYSTSFNLNKLVKKQVLEQFPYQATVLWLCYQSFVLLFSLPFSLLDEGCFLLSVFLECMAHCLWCDNSSSASSWWQQSRVDIQKSALSSLPSDIWPDSTGWNRQWENFSPNFTIFECTLP